MKHTDFSRSTFKIYYLSGVYIHINYNKRKKCQSQQWSKKSVNASAALTRPAELPIALICGMGGRPVPLPIFSVTHAVGLGARPSSSTANWEISAKLWRVVLNVLNTVCSAVHSTSLGAVMEYTIVFKWLN